MENANGVESAEIIIDISFENNTTKDGRLPNKTSLVD